MSKIRIKNFGPIGRGLAKNDGWMDIKKVTLFIGNQGSGKSTVAKLIASFSWMEKALAREDYEVSWFEEEGRFQETFLAYHRLEGYEIKGQTEISYKGQYYHIDYKNGKLICKKQKFDKLALPQIMYYPSERNIISYLQSAQDLKSSSGSLQEFMSVFNEAKDQMTDPVELPINNTKVVNESDTLLIKGEGYDIRLSSASSGFQSLTPLYLVLRYLSGKVKDSSKDSMTMQQSMRFKKEISAIDELEITDEQRRILISVAGSKFQKSYFINIVEEMEQNLFPSSQGELFRSLLKMTNEKDGNTLILTTHSPYLVNELQLANQTALLEQSGKLKILDELYNLNLSGASVSADDSVVYELDEKEGIIRELAIQAGIQSDENYLNLRLSDSNILFDRLLELEDQL